ncbi:hypothetical protein E0H40_29910 [Rhizobium leguminosarum bv. viciae]|nr:hypothetical protein E0H40_29910 [Rhizobium leguminosarum bv. viciae]
MAEHVAFASIRSPAALSRILGVDVRGFKHAVGNQAIAHMKAGHPNLTVDDFKRLPEIVKAGTPRLGKDFGVNGVPRVIYRAQVDGVQYEYIGEVRRRKQRIDAITLYRL